MSRYHRYRRAHGRSRRDAFYDRERRLRARIKHLAGQLQDWVDEPEDDRAHDDRGRPGRLATGTELGQASDQEAAIEDLFTERGDDED